MEAKIANLSSGVKIRAEIDQETVKGLLLINGGGVASILTILSAAIGKNGYEPLVSAAFFGMLGFGFGLLFAILHNMLRRHCSLIYERHSMQPPPGRLFGGHGPNLKSPSVCWWSRSFSYLSVAAFVCAGMYVCAWGVIVSS